MGGGWQNLYFLPDFVVNLKLLQGQHTRTHRLVATAPERTDPWPPRVWPSRGGSGRTAGALGGLAGHSRALGWATPADTAMGAHRGGAAEGCAANSPRRTL